jgi:hypothetical protein
VAYTDMGAGASASEESDAPVLGSPALTGGAFNTLASYLFGACGVGVAGNRGASNSRAGRAWLPA